MAGVDSPADPVFWLHHANVDRIWAQWQAQHPEHVPPNTDESLHPWATTARDVLDHHQLGYMYDAEPAAVHLQSPHLAFDNVQLGETVERPITFTIYSCKTEPVTLEIVDGPTVTSGAPGTRFDTPQGTTVPVTTGAGETEARLPISYTGATVGERTNGTVTVRRRETGEQWTIHLSADVTGTPPSTPSTEYHGETKQSEILCDLLVFWFEAGVFDEFLENQDIDRGLIEEGLNRFCKR